MLPYVEKVWAGGPLAFARPDTCLERERPDRDVQSMPIGTVCMQELEKHEPKIRCVICDKMMCISALIVHLASDHKKLDNLDLLKTIKCRDCSGTFLSRQLMRNHYCVDVGHMDFDLFFKVCFICGPFYCFHCSMLNRLTRPLGLRSVPMWST